MCVAVYTLLGYNTLFLTVGDWLCLTVGDWLCLTVGDWLCLNPILSVHTNQITNNTLFLTVGDWPQAWLC